MSKLSNMTPMRKLISRVYDLYSFPFAPLPHYHYALLTECMFIVAIKSYNLVQWLTSILYYSGLDHS